MSEWIEYDPNECPENGYYWIRASNRAKVVEVSDGNVNGWHTWEGFFHVFNYTHYCKCVEPEFVDSE